MRLTTFLREFEDPTVAKRPNAFTAEIADGEIRLRSVARFDVVYFRPFNFKTEDTERRLRAVQ